jgi:hypothetical protein
VCWTIWNAVYDDQRPFFIYSVSVGTVVGVGSDDGWEWEARGKFRKEACNPHMLGKEIPAASGGQSEWVCSNFENRPLLLLINNSRFKVPDVRFIMIMVVVVNLSCIMTK